MEVLVAMLIFTMAVVYFVSISQGSVFATREAREISTATWLLQNVITQLETRLETEGFDKGCEKKKEAKFEAPYERYIWKTTCEEIDFNLSQTAAQMMQAPEGEEQDRANEDQIQKVILQTASEYLSKSMREIHAEVSWMEGKQRRKVDVTTHIARYDLPLGVPGAASTGMEKGTGSGTGSGTGTGTGGGGN